MTDPANTERTSPTAPADPATAPTEPATAPAEPATAGSGGNGGPRRPVLKETHVHNRHEHVHGIDCGHLAIRHENHVDYAHDGHLHHPHDDHVDEHELGANDVLPCMPKHACDSHPVDHIHGVGCEHVAIPHVGHIDYIVDGHVHRQHGEHCDDHGELRLA